MIAFTQVFVLWLIAAPPAVVPEARIDNLTTQLRALSFRSKEHSAKLAARCVEPGLLATVNYEDMELALRAAALFEETAAVLDELLAGEGRADERMALNLALARANTAAAEMLLKAHACGPNRGYLTRAGKLLLRAFATAGNEAENLAVVEQVQRKLEERRRDFPVPSPRAERRPEPCPVCIVPETRVELPPWPERLVLRVQGGMAWGRRVREKSDESAPGFTQRGATLSVTLMGRAVLAPRWALLFGPSYTYWQGRKYGGGIDVYTANSHQVTARAEVAIGLGSRWREAVSLHPGVEIGIEYIYLDTLPGHADMPITPRGPLFAGNLGICLVAGSVCVWGRVGRPVGTADDYPTLGATVGVDIFGAIRAHRWRRGRR